MNKIELPSWVNAAPKGFGLKSHGKLNAAQWRSACIINLPITLIRLWGRKDGHERQMLDNFLSLVTAVNIGSSKTIIQQSINSYNQSMMLYLQTTKALYPEAKIQPNHHYALHMSMFLENFGPVHSIQTFGFERMNFQQQITPTNKKPGEMELTFMERTCQAANIYSLMMDPDIKSHMADLVSAFGNFINKDSHGTQILNALSLLSEEEMIGKPRNEQKMHEILDKTIYQALLIRLNQETDSLIYADWYSQNQNQPSLSPYSVSCVYLKTHGIQYQPYHISSGNSNVVFQPINTSSEAAGQIIEIFLHTHENQMGNTVEETFVVVKQLVSLSSSDQQYDVFRKYNPIGGILYYAEYSSTIQVIRPQDLVCHFAKTPLQIQDIEKLCIHVLPLDQVG
jgi:hypothetical protein